MFTIEMLPANEGDALWIEYGPDGGEIHRILIDCGRKTAYRTVLDKLEPGQGFELFVLTHVDADHIEGAVPLLQDERIDPALVGDVWFNAHPHLCGEQVVVEPVPQDQLGAQQGEYFAAVLRKRGFPWNKAFDGWPVRVTEDGPLPVVTLPGGMKLTILSPDAKRLESMRKRWERDLDKQEPDDWATALELLGDQARLAPDALGDDDDDDDDDDALDWPPDDLQELADADSDGDSSPPNGSSIAFVAEYEGKRVLFSGDAYAPVLEAGIRRMLEASDATRLALDAFKISHHGSQNNIDFDLLNVIDCSRYLISTSGARHRHPDPEAIARIVLGGGDEVELLFNFANEEQTRWDDDELRSNYEYSARYPDDDSPGYLKVDV